MIPESELNIAKTNLQALGVDITPIEICESTDIPSDQAAFDAIAHLLEMLEKYENK